MRAAPILLATLVGLVAGSARADDPPAPAPPAPPAPSTPPAPRVLADDATLSAYLTADVRRLSASDLGPRWAPVARDRAARWFADRLEALGIAPLPGATKRLFEFGKGDLSGTNAAGWIPGEDESTYVVLAAHVDRRPFDPATKSPGADEASGAAAVLAAAADLAAGPKPKRSVVVVAFDLAGRKRRERPAWLEAPPVPLEGLFGTLVVDRMGRSLGDSWPGLLCVHGAERSAGLDAALSAWSPPAEVAVARLGLDLFGAHPTDAAPFEERRLPVLYVTSGLSRDEGTERDDLARIDLKALLARTRALAALVRALAAAATKPAWIDEPAPTVAEARVVGQIVRKGIERDESGPEAALLLRRAVERHVADLVARGTVTPGERAALRILALQAFGEMSRPPE